MLRQSRKPNTPDTANAVALPPVIFLAALIFGIAINFVFPLQVLPRTAGVPLGLLLILISIPIALSAMRELGKAGTAFDVNRPTTAIVRSGAFRFSRNPVYLGMIMLYLGIAFLINSLWVSMLVVPALIVLQIGVIRREEDYLERKFGEDYRRYKARVRRWV